MQSFEQIRLVGRQSYKSICRAGLGDGTLVAVYAEGVIHLEIQAAVSKCLASLHALGTTYAAFLVNRVFIIRMLYVFPYQRIGGAELFFSCCFKLHGPWPEIGETEVAVSADIECVEAFYGGRRKHTFRGAASALYAFGGIELPNGTLISDLAFS